MLSKKDFSKLSVSLLITKWLKRKIEKRKHTNELVQKYGKWWSNILILILMLGIVGAINDGSVIFGMARAAHTDWYKALSIALVFALVIQYCIGNNVAFLTESFLKKRKDAKYQTNGHTFMRRLFTILIIAGLGFSLYLNTESRRSAENLSSTPTLVNIDSLKLLYTEKLATLDTTYQSEKSMLEETHSAPVATLMNSQKKYEADADATVKKYKKLNRHSDAAYVAQKMVLQGKNYGEQISAAQTAKTEALQALMNKRDARVSKVELDRETEIANAEAKNSATTLLHEKNLSVFGLFIQALNWLANLGKVVLVAAYNRFLFYAEEEEAKTETEEVAATKIGNSASSDNIPLPAEEVKAAAESGQNTPIPTASGKLPEKRKSGRTEKAEANKMLIKRTWEKLRVNGRPLQRDIAEVSGLSERTVRTYLKQLREENQIAA